MIQCIKFVLFSLVISLVYATVVLSAEPPPVVLHSSLPSQVYTPGVYASNDFAVAVPIGTNRIQDAIDLTQHVDPEHCVMLILEGTVDAGNNWRFIMGGPICGRVGGHTARDGSPLSAAGGFLLSSIPDDFVRTKLIVGLSPQDVEGPLNLPALEQLARSQSVGTVGIGIQAEPKTLQTSGVIQIMEEN